LPLLVAGAGIAQHVSASPIRIIVTGVSTNMRLGDAAANAEEVAQVAPGPLTTTQVDDAGHHTKLHRPHRCGGAMRAKAIAISNIFRQALGFPLIEAHPVHPTNDEKEIHGGLIRLVPMSSIGTPVEGGAPGEVQMRPHGHHHHFKHHNASFLRRIHHALMALGPWEGRAVAFVIGCGIGVLLRMVWVMCIITYRMIKGERDEEAEHAELVFEYDAPIIVMPPPQYSDEKVEVTEDKSSTV